MQIEHISVVLNSIGIAVPTLNALVWDATKYTLLLLQPQGELEASIDGVRNRDRALAEHQFGDFLSQAFKSQPDVVVTPEYSLPWNVLVNSLVKNNGPELGKIWVLGCESIRVSELALIKATLAVQDIKVVYEDLPSHDPERFVSPLAYVFTSVHNSSNTTVSTTLVVQFKTHPMGGDFELDSMACGSVVYKFGGINQIALFSLICADVFAFTEEMAGHHHDRALILHLQLNDQPRHLEFLACRYRLLHFSNDVTELLCLNWASNVQLWHGSEKQRWKNIAGSAWYLKPKDFDDKDTAILANHLRGLYYTWLGKLRSHALFFNYQPAIYFLTASKVAHVGVAGPVSRRTGPQLNKAAVWSVDTQTWQEQPIADDGFSAIVHHSGAAAEQISSIAATNPIKAERILALCAGKIERNSSWHKVNSLDSCGISESEIINRITFAQDTHEDAKGFRVARLKRCSLLWNIITDAPSLPNSLADFKNGVRFDWTSTSPHQNTVSFSGYWATVIYMGHESSVEKADEVFKKAADYLNRDFLDKDARSSAKQRLVVWYHDEHDTLKHHKPHEFLRFDQPNIYSEFDLSRPA